MNNTSIEQCCGRAEDKIGSTLDITIQKIEPGSFCTGINGVLIPQKTAVNENQTVTLRMKRHCLPQPYSIILDCQVPKSNGVPLYL